MEEKKNYTVFIFKGRYKEGHFSGSDYIIKSPLKTTLENLGYYNRNMKAFFENSKMVFEGKEVTLEDIRKEVEDGKVIIPLSSEIDKDQVLNYLNIGLYPLFMKAREYSRFKKDYSLEA